MIRQNYRITEEKLHHNEKICTEQINRKGVPIDKIYFEEIL